MADRGLLLLIFFKNYYSSRHPFFTERTLYQRGSYAWKKKG